jgi:hypothetical protein
MISLTILDGSVRIPTLLLHAPLGAWGSSENAEYLFAEVCCL